MKQGLSSVHRFSGSSVQRFSGSSVQRFSGSAVLSILLFCAFINLKAQDDSTDTFYFITAFEKVECQMIGSLGVGDTAMLQIAVKSNVIGSGHFILNFGVGLRALGAAPGSFQIADSTSIDTNQTIFKSFAFVVDSLCDTKVTFASLLVNPMPFTDPNLVFEMNYGKSDLGQFLALIGD